MTENKHLSLGIIGCGWLGRAFAEQSIKQGYNVMVTTQSMEKEALLNKQGFTACQFSLPFEDGHRSPVFDCEQLVICIPPQIRQGKKDYPNKISQLVSAAKGSAVQRIILISTTAIYEGISGVVSEQNELCLHNEKVSLINQAEQCVLSYNEHSVVLRCAGLIGPNRHPGNFFSTSRRLQSPNAFVNLVHQYDVVKLLMLLAKSNFGGVFNCVSDMQVSKQYFYQQAAKALNKASPEFEQNDVENGRLVKGQLLRDVLGYQYKYDDLVAWLSSTRDEVPK